METEKLLELHREHLLGDVPLKDTIRAVNSLNQFLLHRKKSTSSIQINDLEDYIACLMKHHHNDANTLLAITYYLKFMQRPDLYQYMQTLFEGHSILLCLKQRMITYAGMSSMEKIFGGLCYPALGTPLQDFQVFAKDLLDRVNQHLSVDIQKKVFIPSRHQTHEHYQLEKQVFTNLGLPIYEHHPTRTLPIRNEFEKVIPY